MVPAGKMVSDVDCGSSLTGYPCYGGERLVLDGFQRLLGRHQEDVELEDLQACVSVQCLLSFQSPEHVVCSLGGITEVEERV